MQIKRGDFILVHTPRSIICWLIRKITRSHWNHVAWVTTPITILEAQGDGGVQQSNIEKYDLDDPNLTKVLRINDGILTPRQIDRAIARASLSEGRPYDYGLILRLLWLYITGSRKTKAIGDWDNEWICSELIAKPLWNATRFRIRDDVPVNNIVPEDFVKSPYLYEIKRQA